MEKLTNVRLVSGQINYPSLTNKVTGKNFAEAKIHLWMLMLNEGKKPTKWLKTNSKGTKVNFDYIHNQEEYESGLSELSDYISEVNNLYDLEYTIKKELVNLS